MVPFTIVADLRTGSTLLATTLDRHPQVRCYGELFHPDDLPDNRPSNLEATRCSADELLRAALGRSGHRARGFKAMSFLPLESAGRWPDAWEAMHRVPRLRVVWLTRRDRLAQYASVVIARRTGVFHPHDHDDLYRPERRPSVRIDPAELRAWVGDRDALLARRRRQLHGAPSLELEYEKLTEDWEASIARVQQFLGVDVLPLEPAKRRQETRPLAEVIRNYDELVRSASE
jgi:LPS sulfotransferase NodH